MRHRAKRTPPQPLDGEGLERLALFYAGRYATTRAKLRSYLARKVKERGWKGESDPPLERIVERFSELGYVDDRAFATSRTASLLRRGFGGRRISQALHAAGIAGEDAEPSRGQIEQGEFDAALRFAERKRIGPYAEKEADRPGRQKAIAALLRAGHSIDVARRIATSRPGEIPESNDP